jgi:hypothetical protein
VDRGVCCWTPSAMLSVGTMISCVLLCDIRRSIYFYGTNMLRTVFLCYTIECAQRHSNNIFGDVTHRIHEIYTI